MAGKVAEVAMRWLEGLQFEGHGTSGETSRPMILVDGDTRVATSPVELLLLSAATCTASDVVIILQKQRVGLQALEVIIRGTRREEHPRRFTAIALHFTVRGTGVDETKVRRAIDLSIEKYCSVAASLAPDIQLSYDVSIA
jgi:putative redox protein